MIKRVFLTWFFIFAMLSSGLQAKEYPVLLLGVQSVHGSYIGGWERDKFLDGLERELSRKGDIKLVRRAPFLLEVDISGYSKNFSTDIGKFLDSKQFRFKQSVRLKGRYWVFDIRGRELYNGTLPYNVKMDTGSSISYKDAMMKARESMLFGLGERIGSRINDRFHFMVDFEDQLDDQYGKRKSYKNASAGSTKSSTFKGSGSVKLSQNSSLDIEKRSVGKKTGKSDLKWEGLPGKDDMHFFRPLNKAKFALVKGKSYGSIKKSYVKGKKLSMTSIMVLDFDSAWKKGMVLVFKTTEGYYGKMKVLGFKKKGSVQKHTISIKWEIFK